MVDQDALPTVASATRSNIAWMRAGRRGGCIRSIPSWPGFAGCRRSSMARPTSINGSGRMSGFGGQPRSGCRATSPAAGSARPAHPEPMGRRVRPEAVGRGDPRGAAMRGTVLIVAGGSRPDAVPSWRTIRPPAPRQRPQRIDTHHPRRCHRTPSASSRASRIGGTGSCLRAVP